MGLNHRGGGPGFVRVYEENKQTGDERAHDEVLSESPTTTYVVLPDHSGNRFYQSLGNVQSDRLVGCLASACSPESKLRAPST